MFWRLFAVVSIGLWAASLSFAKSELPDHDASKHPNNDFATAPEIDILRLNARGEAQGTHRTEELGKVLGGFDTQDIYKFRIPSGENRRLRFFMRERPDTTVAIQIFRDPQQDPVGEGVGNPFERFVVNLTPGTYFMRVFTSPNSALDRKLVYDLTVTPEFLPLPDVAGPDCRTSVDLGVVAGGRRISGSVSDQNPLDTYRFHVVGDADIGIARLHGLVQNTISIVDRVSDDRFVLAMDRGQSYPDLNRLLDPGFYCLHVAKGAAGAQSLNYEFDLIATVSRVRPSQTRDATDVTAFNLGNLTNNGQYKGRRYIEAHPTPLLSPSREYIVREWIGFEEGEHWLRFSVASPGLIKIGLDKAVNLVGVELQDSAGVTIETGQREVGQLTNLSPVRLSATIKAGTYHIRIPYLGHRQPGTNYSLSVFFVPTS